MEGGSNRRPPARNPHRQHKRHTYQNVIGHHIDRRDLAIARSRQPRSVLPAETASSLPLALPCHPRAVNGQSCRVRNSSVNKAVTGVGTRLVKVNMILLIVSLVKIGSLATVILGISFWSYAAFALCFTAALTQLDRVQLWERIEELSA